MSVLSQVHFHDEVAAVARLETIVWPNGPVCPHCGNADPKRVYAIKGKTARPGLRTCAECRKQFTVKVGTVFEDSKVPLHKWFQAAHLLASSKKGFSTHRLHCVLEVTYRTAWFMMHRLREAMREGSLAAMGGVSGLPGAGGIVEANETFIGREPGVEKRRGWNYKMKVVSLVDRDSKQVRSVVVDNLKPDTIRPIVEANIVKEASLITDEAAHYAKIGPVFSDHQNTTHGVEEYVRGTVHKNTVEGYFYVFKRGMKGVYQHGGKQHLHRYLAEFDFRYNNRVKLGINDGERTIRALRGIIGKRLMYRDSSGFVH